MIKWLEELSHIAKEWLFSVEKWQIRGGMIEKYTIIDNDIKSCVFIMIWIESAFISSPIILQFGIVFEIAQQFQRNYPKL